MDQYSIVSRVAHYLNIDELFEYKILNPQFYDICKSELYPYETNEWFKHHLKLKSNDLEFGDQWLKQKGIFDKITGLHFTIRLFANQIGITIRSIFNKTFSFVIPLKEVIITDTIKFGIKCDMLDLPIADKTKTILWITFLYTNLVYVVLIEINLPMLMKYQHCYYLVERFKPHYPSCGGNERKRISLFHTKCPNPVSHKRFISMLYKMYPELNNCPTDDWILTNKYHKCVQQKNRTFIYNSQDSENAYDSEIGKLTVCKGSEIKHFELKHGRLFVLNGRWIVHDLSINNSNDSNVFVYDYKQDFKVTHNFHLGRFDTVHMFDHHHIIISLMMGGVVLFNLKTNQKKVLPNHLSFKIISQQSTIINNTLYYFDKDQFDDDKIITTSLHLKQTIINSQ